MWKERVCGQRYFTYESLIENINNWNIRAQIKQKYQTWQLKYSLPKLCPTWLSLIHHSLVYYLLKNIDYIFYQLQTDWIIIHSYSMKSAYSKIILQKLQNFDFKLIILVKTITYYIGRHIHEILADCSLETDIYQLIIHNLLGKNISIKGISVQPSAYACILQQMKSVEATKKQKEPRNLQNFVEKPSLNDFNVRPLLFPTRRQTKKQSVDKMMQITEQHNNLLEFHALLKENLYVKPASTPQRPKYSIHQLRQLDQQLLDQKLFIQKQTVSLPHKDRQLKKKNQTLHSNQLSTAFNYGSQLKLKDVKKFTIQRSASKLEPLRHLYHPQLPKKQYKLQMKGLDIKSKRDSKSKLKLDENKNKTTKEWNQLVKNMKNQLYGSWNNNECKTNKKNRNYDEEVEYPRLRLRDKTNLNNKRPINNYQSSQSNGNIRFHKLNLMNNPNVLVLQENAADIKEQQVVQFVGKSYSLFHMKDENPPKKSQLQLTRHKPSFFSHNYPLICQYEHTVPI